MRLTQPENGILPPEGDHLATLTEIEDLGEQPNPFDDGKMRHRLNMIFDVDGRSQYYYVTASLHPQATLYSAAQALLGISQIPKSMDTDELIGLQCMVTIEWYDGEKGKRSKITKMWKYERRTPQTAAKPPEPKAEPARRTPF
jgi:hypothetical protein